MHDGRAERGIDFGPQKSSPRHLPELSPELILRSPFGFDDAFEKLSGYRPMGWQRRLYLRLIEGRVPEALDLPTGLPQDICDSYLADCPGARRQRRRLTAALGVCRRSPGGGRSSHFGSGTDR